jgi:hypothetical protein
MSKSRIQFCLSTSRRWNPRQQSLYPPSLQQTVQPEPCVSLRVAQITCFCLAGNLSVCHSAPDGILGFLKSGFGAKTITDGRSLQIFFRNY